MIFVAIVRHYLDMPDYVNISIISKIVTQYKSLGLPKVEGYRGDCNEELGVGNEWKRRL